MAFIGFRRNVPPVQDLDGLRSYLFECQLAAPQRLDLLPVSVTDLVGERVVRGPIELLFRGRSATARNVPQELPISRSIFSCDRYRKTRDGYKWYSHEKKPRILHLRLKKPIFFIVNVRRKFTEIKRFKIWQQSAIWKAERRIRFRVECTYSSDPANRFGSVESNFSIGFRRNNVFISGSVSIIVEARRRDVRQLNTIMK